MLENEMHGVADATTAAGVRVRAGMPSVFYCVLMLCGGGVV